ncbi:hypothetical protein [Pseudomonas sp. CM27]|uniref:hypothetical protein n=1 Tax=Pseudomonas sp. CM27 TaxID=2738452 RepID=UPI001556637F|nr:hypothetical protein [Pseudomonas sp. CM27]NQD77766.1 hypothetical protein [Pseudomonas sp. CM27]
MLTDDQIEAAKKATKYTHNDHLHEHPDCIRFAYEWLDAQTKIKGLQKRPFAIKHLVERWAGRYVSQSDVEVAATLHPEIRGTYPAFNISARLVNPSRARIAHLGETGKHHYKQEKGFDDYASSEG